MARTRPARGRRDAWAAWPVSLADWRKLLDIGPGPGDYLAMSIEDPTAARPIRFELCVDGYELHTQLDESEAGEIFDTLAQALRELIAAQAQGKLRTDTPPRGIPLSDRSASIQDRG